MFLNHIFITCGEVKKYNPNHKNIRISIQDHHTFIKNYSGHAQADMVTEVYGHIIDEDRRKNAEMMENAFYNKENLNPQMKGYEESSNTIAVPEGVDAELLMKVLGNPEMAALLTSLAKTMKV